MKIIIVLMAFILPEVGYSFDMKKCFEYQNKKASFRKYDFKYLAPSSHPSDSVNVSVPSKTTSAEGLSKYSSENSIQGSTMIFDPGVSTAGTTGNTQFSSSFGECSMLGYQDSDKRDAYVASHWNELRQEIAIGTGDHLATLVKLSGCKPEVYDVYIDEVRDQYDTYESATDFASGLNHIIKQNSQLHSNCRFI